MRQQIKEYLIFSKKERIGFVILMILVAIIFIVPPFFNHKRPSPLVVEEIKTNENIKGKEEDHYKENNYSFHEENNTTYSLFNFDPNNASADDWKKLGLKDKTIHTIQNYLSKGGHFYKPTDLQKIYGLRKDEYERLLPYIHLSYPTNNNYEKREYVDKQNNYTSTDQNEKRPPVNTPLQPSTYKKKTIIVDINTADTAAWMELPGIGSKRAWSIVNFRNKLGGFYSINQVGETYNIPDSVFQQIKSMLQLNAAQIKKININTATKDELKMHPYIKWNLANAIVEYRNQHGNFTSLEQLNNIVLITPEIYNKIAPYLTID